MMYDVVVNTYDGKHFAVSYDTKEAAVNGIAYAYRNFGAAIKTAKVSPFQKEKQHTEDYKPCMTTI